MHNLRHDEVEECASGFVLHMLLTCPDLWPTQMPLPPPPEAWLLRCADNWIRNFVRSLGRQRHQETLLTESPIAGGSEDPVLVALAPSPLHTLLAQELHARLRASTLHLTPLQRDLFARYYVDGETAAAIALATRRTPGAIRQALHVVRCRLYRLLEQEGLSQEEASDYLLLLHRE